MLKKVSYVIAALVFCALIWEGIIATFFPSLGLSPNHRHVFKVVLALTFMLVWIAFYRQRSERLQESAAKAKPLSPRMEALANELKLRTLSPKTLKLKPPRLS